MAFSWVRRRRKHDAQEAEALDDSANAHASIRLRIEHGLLMAFGPDGDPVTPALLRAACSDDAVDGPRMENGTIVDRRKVLAVIEAQQRGSLSDQRSDGWIEAMLGLRGSFEPTPDHLLAGEPDDHLPPLPDDEGRSGPITVSVPLAFDEAERAAMADADALLFRGLSPAMRPSAGRYDPSIDGWILRPDDLADLAMQRTADGANAVDLEVMAVMIEGGGTGWPITTKRIEFS